MDQVSDIDAGAEEAERPGAEPVGLEEHSGSEVGLAERSGASKAAESKPLPPRFRFIRGLGRGVLGEAHEVRDAVRGEPVVLKVFLRARPAHPDRFKLEFEALARLEHPSLVRYFHLVDPSSDTDIVVEEQVGERGLAFTQALIDGVDLLTHLRQPATPEELALCEERRSPTTGELPEAEDDEGAGEPESGAALDLPVPTDELSEPATGEVTGEAAGPDGAEPEGIAGEESAADIVEAMAAEVDSSEASAGGPPLDVVLLRLERLIPDLAAGLGHLHKFQKVHGTLRPSNILVTRDGACQLTDYGIVPHLVYREPTTNGAESASRSGAACSLLQAPENLPFVAPECADGRATVAGDLYALGCVLYEAIAGRSPFEVLEWSKEEGAILRPPPLAEMVPGCPASWAEMVDGLMGPRPADRPALRRVVEIVTGEEARPVAMPPTVVPEPDVFVGRAELMARLREVARESADQRLLRLLIIEGETGVGKTTLVDAASHWLARRGWTVLRGQCYDRESVIYQGWHEIAAQIGALCDALPPAQREAMREDRELAGVLFPVLAPEPGATARGAGRLTAIGGLRRLLVQLSEERPMLLCLEDLHWASWDTASLLVDLFSDTEGIRCLVLGTWRSDAGRAEGHLLQTDLDLSLIDVLHLPVSGFQKDEARQYVVQVGSDLEVDAMRRILRAGRLNPRLLQELIFDTMNTRGALDALAAEADSGPPNALEVLRRVFQARMAKLGRRDRAILEILTAASGPLEDRIICRAVEVELGGSVLPTESSREALEQGLASLIERRLVREAPPRHDGKRRFTVLHDLCRQVVSRGLDERDLARLSGRIADAYGQQAARQADLRFEYELRAGRVARAVEPAIGAAREAELRFAYHRAAKLWRWLDGHADRLPSYVQLVPSEELARTEQLAGRHTEAAALYGAWAEGSEDPSEKARIRLREASAWLQAGDLEHTVAALDRGLQALGESYRATLLTQIADVPKRLLSAVSRWTPDRVTEARVDAATEEERVRGQLYYLAADVNSWLASNYGRHFEACLSRLAERTGDARLLGMERLKLAEFHAGAGIERRRERAMQWVEEADAFFEKADDWGWRAEASLQKASLLLRYGDLGAAGHALDEAMKRSKRAGAQGAFDMRRALFWTGQYHLRMGQLDAAERASRRMLHVFRGDRFAAVLAYECLSEAALYRGERARAELFIDAGRRSVQWSRPNLSTVRWARITTMFQLAMGRPEVAVGQMDVTLEQLYAAGVLDIDRADAEAHLCLGQALAALCERQRGLAEPRTEVTLDRLRRVCRRLQERFEGLNRQLQAEVLRLVCRFEMLRDRPKRALREIERAIAILGDSRATLDVARCTEIHGMVLVKKERPEGRALIEQAREVYAHCQCRYPLILEGWPIPRSAAALREE